jgi:hypothetical protein
VERGGHAGPGRPKTQARTPEDPNRGGGRSKKYRSPQGAGAGSAFLGKHALFLVIAPRSFEVVSHFNALSGEFSCFWAKW